MSFLNIFNARSRTTNAWFSAGLATSFPNITTSSSTLSDLLPCKDSSFIPGCKVFQVPSNDSSRAIETNLEDMDAGSTNLKEQVVVFQFRGQFHAIDHVSR
jgi:hypothetical protein